MAETSREAIKIHEKQRADIEDFWGKVFQTYFERHHEYPPLLNKGMVQQFILHRGANDPSFRQKVESYGSALRSVIEDSALAILKKIQEERNREKK